MTPISPESNEQLAQALARHHTYNKLNDLLAGLLAAGDWGHGPAHDAVRVLQRALSLRALRDYQATVRYVRDLEGAEAILAARRATEVAS